MAPIVSFSFNDHSILFYFSTVGRGDHPCWNYILLFFKIVVALVAEYFRENGYKEEIF